MKPNSTTGTHKRVLVVNKFFYPRGGDCVCTINLEQLLREHGHTTAVYAMTYPENIPSEWTDTFASEVRFDGGLKDKLRALRRTLGMGDIRDSFTRVLDEFKPDIVHLNNIHSYLSPVLAELAHARGIKVVWTLHDYKLICPSYSCLYHGEVCERCFRGKMPVLTRRCMKGSLPASVIAWIEALKWNRKRLERSVDTFICPSRFMAEKMAQGGFDKAKLTTLSNFVDLTKIQKFAGHLATERDDYYCYIGRLSPEKGVRTLLEAASRVPYTLKIAGGGPLLDELRGKYAECKNIEFLGHLDAESVARLLSFARFSVMPSEWYENNPLGVIESLCAGTPVVGARIGGIPELISPESGMPYTSGSVDGLIEAIEQTWAARWDYADIQRKALNAFAPETHYQKLMKTYENS